MTQSNVDKTEWFVAEAEAHGKPIIYRSLLKIPPKTETLNYPTLVSIFWKYEMYGDSGMPDKQTSDHQLQFESEMDDLERSKDSIMVLVVTGVGLKEWHWYVRDYDSWMKQLNMKLNAHEVFPIEIRKNKMRSGRFFESFVPVLAVLMMIDFWYHEVNHLSLQWIRQEASIDILYILFPKASRIQSPKFPKSAAKKSVQSV